MLEKQVVKQLRRRGLDNNLVTYIYILVYEFIPLDNSAQI